MKKIIEDVRDRIANGDSKGAISILYEYLKKTQSKFLHDSAILSGRVSELSQKERNGLILLTDYNLENVKISYSILSLLNELVNDPNNDKEVDQNEANKAFEKIKILIKSYNYFERTENLKIEKGEIIQIPDYIGFENAINYHKKTAEIWAKTISFKDLQKPKETSEVYVELDFYLTPRKSFVDDPLNEKLINIKYIFDNSSHNIVVLGQPGAGKTTTMKMIINWLLKPTNTNLSRFKFPLLVRLREINEGGSNSGLCEKLFDILGMSILEKELYEKKQGVFKRLLTQLIEDLHVLIILDGFDEIKPNLKGQLLNDIKLLSNGLSSSKFILTSRSGEYDEVLENTSEFEISPLNDIQIKTFILNWLQDKSKSDELFAQITSSPFADTAIRPLVLSHLCALYERYLKIPDKPKTVYKKIVNLLIEEWDLQRGISRGSKYSQFEVDRKFEFLSHLAYYLTIQYNRTTFNTKELIKAYKDIHTNFALPENESKIIVTEIESHTGIFIQSGYDKYEFAHKSIQEFLTAEYFVKLPIIPKGKEILKIPSEIALAIALSSNPTLYFTTLVFERLIGLDFSIAFYNSLLERITIEKPDFYTNPSLGVSALSLYTKCIYMFHITGQSNGFAKWKFFFKKFIELPNISESISLIKPCYIPYKDGILSTSDINGISRALGLYYNDIPKLIHIGKKQGITILRRDSKIHLKTNTPDPNIVFFDENLFK
jgi:Cdc6-like AAA superfamily ATPase